ncbi:MAG: hypothetical protein PHF86_13065 [Candidatus Nanoarchaeia archaeon]|jgi:hypothetical protein|nr:hypothetical protein [Candidatus Nanoarchaeia archaeon]
MKKTKITPLSNIKKLFVQAEEGYKKLEDQEDVLEIDITKLEVQSAKQPSIFYSCSKIVADLVYLRQNAKAQVDLFYSNLDSKIRENPEKYGVVKFSETAVKSAILRNESYIKIMDYYNRIVAIIDKANSFISAIDQRRSMLKIEQALFVSDYFNRDTVVDYTEAHSRTKKANKIRQKLEDIKDDLNEKA